ncbi:GntR family transcriptional regulator [Mesorhizobium sp.]|uniref:GntR family transcriptional regulator n=1 Tax=Mesorhizobium sp. TaxID=1871066 RepID=UPI000FEA405E|nr:GntR family transcriptional regulator [Mesorhizobium sp.]RWM45502.1 MAG: GntR family transcriptional regulator [Mesorhizobium sp.]RWM58178.1 MAG: GntR family transcriptional regulator [Mesorhizobium sp.]RWM58657.1 MAG: GntR family transcriptional regulator [Mesorhizobium sp.]TIO70044.1 MAG: GntR family transcriptional regulator [Mesorhizobium sp.]TIR03310.1 MAG: GntR family transcriptional regulator [Mesorhizobium sp.]
MMEQNDLPLLAAYSARFERLAPSKTMAETAYDRVSELLMDGAYQPGDRLVTRAVANELDIGLTPVREALLRLAGEGTLDQVNSRAMTVPILSAARLVEIYKLRLALEPMIAAEAIDKISVAAFSNLEASMVAMADAYKRQDYRAAFKQNRRFHFAIYQAAEMPFVLNVIRSAWRMVGPMFRQADPGAADPKEALEIHSGVMDALKRRNAAQLRSWLCQDLKRGRRLLRSLID